MYPICLERRKSANAITPECMPGRGKSCPRAVTIPDPTYYMSASTSCLPSISSSFCFCANDVECLKHSQCEASLENCFYPESGRKRRTAGTALLFSQWKRATLPVGNPMSQGKEKREVLQGTLALMVLKTL